MQYYSGIGGRTVTEEIVTKMTSIGKILAKKGMILRTGNCKGSDHAFQAGANEIDPSLVHLYIPYKNYEKNSVIEGNHKIWKSPAYIEKIYSIAENHHPNWESCSDMAKKFHARNVMIVLGEDLKTPSQFVICWTWNGEKVGGTAMGISVAETYKIPVYNLFSEKDTKELLDEVILANSL